jgi:hypothetical protein
MFFSETLRPNSVQWISGALCPGPKRLQCDTDRSPLPNADVKLNYDLFNIVSN